MNENNSQSNQLKYYFPFVTIEYEKPNLRSTTIQTK